MKLQILSDLHTDVAPIKPIKIGDDVDAVMVAGDTCQGVRHAFVALRRIVPERVPIVMVAGNHEFYRRCIQSEITEAKAIAANYNVVFLENDVALLGTTRFTRVIGATLWTNYRVFGATNATVAMETARRSLNDHRVISWSKMPWLRFRPEEALLLHERSKAFIVDALNTPFSGGTVILTHHAPHFGSVAKGPYQSDILTAAYASDLTDVLLIDAAAGASNGVVDATVKETSSSNWNRVWLHGHIHSSVDYVVATTRILANSHGYGLENPSFKPQLIVEVGS